MRITVPIQRPIRDYYDSILREDGKDDTWEENEFRLKSKS